MSVTNISADDPKTAWATAGHKILESVARNYHRTITYKDFAADLQTETGLENKAPLNYWIGEVLDLVAQECSKDGQPLLTAFCVSKDTGEVSGGYAIAAKAMYGDSPQDPEMHAAVEREKCHHFFGAKIPPIGAGPMLTPQVARRRKLDRAKAVAERPRDSCPNCNLRLPYSGECGNCS